MINYIYASTRCALQSQIAIKDIIMNCVIMVYSIVFDITWWMFVRGKPALKQWAIAENLICIFIFSPTAVVYWNWRGFLRAELGWWPVILIGVFGIIIFSIPYRGWTGGPRAGGHGLDDLSQPHRGEKGGHDTYSPHYAIVRIWHDSRVS
jgi:hypothetical protein